MRIAIDAMGGDDAPAALVDGAIDFARQEPEHQLKLVGDQTAIAACLRASGGSGLSNIEIVHAAEAIDMAAKIAALREKREASINVATRLVADGEADAVILCGNTACSVAAAQLHLRRIRGVKRAGILTPLPNEKGGHTWVIDCGANALGKAEHLAQFAQMTGVFLQCYRGQNGRPTAGVLNIGEEIGKGNSLTSETLALLSKEVSLDLHGYVEGNDIYTGCVDIVVCDGFTGNVLLKASEGVASAIGKILKEEIKRGLLTTLGGLLTKPAFQRLKARTSWHSVGGCLLLGVNGLTVIGHGRSDRVAVKHAIAFAVRCAKIQVVEHLRSTLSTHLTDD